MLFAEKPNGEQLRAKKNQWSGDVQRASGDVRRAVSDASNPSTGEEAAARQLQVKKKRSSATQNGGRKAHRRSPSLTARRTSPLALCTSPLHWFFSTRSPPLMASTTAASPSSSTIKIFDIVGSGFGSKSKYMFGKVII
ncbi:hypothetical protein RIF29_32904 [Crotalaria pallida]|uniref:Uncharacterized protein n=1 Tax=Crotalaria pallida TaxID=3830 RepID=A0AAN9EA28_CROPI